MSCVGANLPNMNTKAFHDLRTSDQRNFSYKIDAGIHKKLENKQRVDGVGSEQATRQYEMEKHLSDSEIRKQQKIMRKKMIFLKNRLDECRERHDAKVKKSQQWEEKERERMQREYEESKKPRSRGRDRGDKTFVTSNFPAKNSKPAGEDTDTKPEENPIPKRQKLDYHYEISKKAPLSEPSAIWSVRRQRRTTDQETGRFLYRALTNLEKVGEKHHEQYMENVKKLRQLERNAGMRIDRRGTPESIRREPWWMVRPETPVANVSSFLSQLEVKEREMYRTLDKLRQTYPSSESSHVSKNTVRLEPITRSKTFSMPETAVTQATPDLGDRHKTEEQMMEKKVTFVDEPQSRCKTIVATKDDIMSKRSFREIKEIEREKLEECNARVADFLNKENPNAKLPPPKDKFAIEVEKPSLELPRLNIFVMSGSKFKEAEVNPFMEGLELPQVSRSRDLLDNSSKEADAMWAWLGFETQEDFIAAVKGFKKSKKREKELEETNNGPQSALLTQLELAGVDAAQLKKLAQLESMLPDGFNDLDLESDDDTEPEEEEEDPQFAVFDKKVIDHKKKKKSAKKSPVKRKNSVPIKLGATTS